jgi:hypothetical protein
VVVPPVGRVVLVVDRLNRRQKLGCRNIHHHLSTCSS